MLRSSYTPPSRIHLSTIKFVLGETTENQSYWIHKILFVETTVSKKYFQKRIKEFFDVNFFLARLAHFFLRSQWDRAVTLGQARIESIYRRIRRFLHSSTNMVSRMPREVLQPITAQKTVMTAFFLRSIRTSYQI